MMLMFFSKKIKKHEISLVGRKNLTKKSTNFEDYELTTCAHNIIHINSIRLLEIFNNMVQVNCGDVHFRPCFSNCSGNVGCSGTCWTLMLVQAILALILLSFHGLRRGWRTWSCRWRKRPVKDKEVTPNIDSTLSASRHDNYRNIMRKSQKDIYFPRDQDIDYSVESIDNGEEMFLPDEIKYEVPSLAKHDKTNPRDEKSPVLRTFRSQDNFFMKNEDHDIVYPAIYDPEYVPLVQDSSQWWRILLATIKAEDASGYIVTCAGFAFLSSAMSSFVVMVYKYEDELQNHCDEDVLLDRADYSGWIRSNGSAFSIAMGKVQLLYYFLR